MSEWYCSIDVETDGPIPAVNSMLSLGAAAFLPDGTLIDTFSMNLSLYPGASPDPNTQKFWEDNKEAYEKTRESTLPPETVMKRFVAWVETHKEYGRPTCVAYPAGFDFLWVYFYLRRFLGSSPFSFSCLDIKTYAMAVLNTEYRESTKKNFPKHWFPDDPHTHIAVEDAIEQGKIFCAMLKENTNGKS